MDKFLPLLTRYNEPAREQRKKLLTTFKHTFPYYGVESLSRNHSFRKSRPFEKSCWRESRKIARNRLEITPLLSLSLSLDRFLSSRPR